MSSKDLAVSVRGLSKSYTIAHNAVKHSMASEALIHGIKNIGKRSTKETFWALQDVSFDISKGEVVGIIGRNGAGKSTLLKVLSQITEPTKGEIRLYGRVGALLEVGTGFHPELTGRENIFLNGAILGMKKSEISRQFDEIVDFAEVEKFLDTPVKRYSSGMYVRLAFAVAAHLNPEILIVDEVLAVGDAQFQKKCLGKMQNVSQQEGKTVLFVSHNMAAIEHMCSSAILLSKGTLKVEGETSLIVSEYLSQASLSHSETLSLADRKDRSGTGEVKLTNFFIEDQAGLKLDTVFSGMDVNFVFEYRADASKTPRQVDVGFSIQDNKEQTLFVLYSSYTAQTFDTVPTQGSFRCRVNQLPLVAGHYNVGARVLVNGVEADWPKDSIGSFNVEVGDFYGSGNRGFDNGTSILVNGAWEVAPVETYLNGR